MRLLIALTSISQGQTNRNSSDEIKKKRLRLFFGTASYQRRERKNVSRSSVGQRYRVVHLAAGRIQTGDEHHVVLTATDDLLVYPLDVIGAADAHTVDVKDDKSVFDAGLLELPVTKTAHLNADGDLKLTSGIAFDRRERTAEVCELARTGDRYIALHVAQCHLEVLVLVVADDRYDDRIAGTMLGNLLLQLTCA